jgi:hypothetical protein
LSMYVNVGKNCCLETIIIYPILLEPVELLCF